MILGFDDLEEGFFPLYLCRVPWVLSSLEAVAIRGTDSHEHSFLLDDSYNLRYTEKA